MNNMETAASHTHQTPQLLCWSAASPVQLQQTVAAFIQAQPQQRFALADIAFTLQQGRRALPVRYAQVQRATEPLKLEPSSLLPSIVDTSSLVWVFAGQGTQYSGMLAGLYQQLGAVREQVDHCCDLLQRHGAINLKPLLLEASEAHDQQLQNTALAQPALFIQAIAQVTLWQQLGLQPATSFGHSLGEYCAAWQVGVWSLETALELVYRRGQLMATAAAGAMLACRCEAARLQTLPETIRARFDIAALNGIQRTVLSVAQADVADVSNALTQAGIDFSRLLTSHGFHSRMMEPLLADFHLLIQRSAPQPPQQPWLSNLTGQPVTADQATSADYWCQHLRQPVQFSTCAQTALQLYPQALLLEIGPGQNMTALLAELGAPQCASARGRHSCDQYADWLEAIGQLWQYGITPDWKGVALQHQPGRVPLPGTVLNPTRCWAEATEKDDITTTQVHNAEITADNTAASAPVRERLEAIWCRVLGVTDVQDDDSFFALGGNSIHLLEMTRLAAAQELIFSVAQAYEFTQFRQLCDFLNHQNAQDHQSLPHDSDALVQSAASPQPFDLCQLDDHHFQHILQQVRLHPQTQSYSAQPEGDTDVQA